MKAKPKANSIFNGRLGKHKARNDPRVLRLAKYFDPEIGLPSVPDKADWSFKVPTWPMMLNDRLGDCAIAAPGHMIELWTSFTNEVTPSDQDILNAYSAVSGYDPSSGSNDNGCSMYDVLEYWRDVGIGGHKIDGFAQIDVRRKDHVKFAVWAFGCAYTGVQLPQSAAGQATWDVPDGGPYGDGAPGSWGGHAIPIVSYDADNAPVITWGQKLTQTWNFFATYCDECFVVLSRDWLNQMETPSGFKLADLQADLAAIAAS